MNYQELREENKKHAEKFFDLMNPFGNEEDYAKEFVNVMNHTHPTLCQTAFRFFSIVIREYAGRETGQHYDMRNEASVKWAVKVTKIDAGFPCI